MTAAHSLVGFGPESETDSEIGDLPFPQKQKHTVSVAGHRQKSIFKKTNILRSVALIESMVSPLFSPVGIGCEHPNRCKEVFDEESGAPR